MAGGRRALPPSLALAWIEVGSGAAGTSRDSLIHDMRELPYTETRRQRSCQFLQCVDSEISPAFRREGSMIRIAGLCCSFPLVTVTLNANHVQTQR